MHCVPCVCCMDAVSHDLRWCVSVFTCSFLSWMRSSSSSPFWDMCVPMYVYRHYVWWQVRNTHTYTHIHIHIHVHVTAHSHKRQHRNTTVAALTQVCDAQHHTYTTYSFHDTCDRCDACAHAYMPQFVQCVMVHQVCVKMPQVYRNWRMCVCGHHSSHI